MLRSCAVCGGIHQEDQMCKRQEDQMCKRKYKKDSRAYHFRNSNKWILKREEIKKRDKYLCQVCLKYGRFIYQDVQVHHIIPINKDYDKRLDSNNLITLCTLHHKDAERGIISVEELHSLIDSPRG